MLSRHEKHRDICCSCKFVLNQSGKRIILGMNERTLGIKFIFFLDIVVCFLRNAFSFSNGFVLCCKNDICQSCQLL